MVGPHPYPQMVRDFQRIIGDETKEQILAKEGRLPDKIYACVGGGSNAIGMFYPFLEDKEVELIAAEAGGLGVETGKHAVVLSDEVESRIGVLQGMKTALLADEFGNIIAAHSISAGLDYPGIGPEHAYLKEIKRVRYEVITDQEALEAFELLSKSEGIIPALESSHAVALAVKEIEKTTEKDLIVINISGRGDKDTHTVMAYFNQGKTGLEDFNK